MSQALCLTEELYLPFVLYINNNFPFSINFALGNEEADEEYRATARGAGASPSSKDVGGNGQFSEIYAYRCNRTRCAGMIISKTACSDIFAHLPLSWPHSWLLALLQSSLDSQKARLG